MQTADPSELLFYNIILCSRFTSLKLLRDGNIDCCDVWVYTRKIMMIIIRNRNGTWEIRLESRLYLYSSFRPLGGGPLPTKKPKKKPSNTSTKTHWNPYKGLSFLFVSKLLLLLVYTVYIIVGFTSRLDPLSPKLFSSIVYYRNADSQWGV